MRSKETQKKIKEYQNNFLLYGSDSRALKWLSPESAEIRYRELIKDIDFENKTILDVGCGFGDIIPFIKSKSSDFEYLGVDMVEDFIKEAKKRYPSFDFKIIDYFSKPIRIKFDIIICCGALNSKFKSIKSYQREAIKIMFGNAKEAICFNMAGSHPRPLRRRESKLYYSDSLEILKFCLSLTNKIIFRQNYHKRDFTISMWK